MNLTGGRVAIFLISLSLISCRTQVAHNNQHRVGNREADRPNVLFIYVDQLRRYSAGYWSGPNFEEDVVGKPDPVITPNIDNLANDGVVATQAIANFPLCSPSRGMMLSGLYPQQNGLWNNARKDRTVSLRSDIKTMTDIFSEAGYSIGYFGKAHYIQPEPYFDKEGNYVGRNNPNGGYFINDYDTYVPPGKDRHSIDYFLQNVKDVHFNPMTYSNDPQLVEGHSDGEVFYPKRFSTEVESEALIKFLKSNQGERKHGSPFFAIWSINPPHSPWDPANTDMEEYHKYYDINKYPNVESLLVRENVKIDVSKDYVRNYFANTTAIDKYIGLVVEQLEELDLLNNTMIIFSADHGEMMGSQGLQNKNVLFTEAMAVPFIISWREGLSSGKTNVLLGSPDILPTILKLAGVEKYTPSNIEGSDLSKWFVKGKKQNNRNASLLLMLDKARGLQTHRYTLVIKEENNDFDAYIFDNKLDPYQQNKITLEEDPLVSKKLLKELALKLRTTNDPWYLLKKANHIIPYQH